MSIKWVILDRANVLDRNEWSIIIFEQELQKLQQIKDQQLEKIFVIYLPTLIYSVFCWGKTVISDDSKFWFLYSDFTVRDKKSKFGGKRFSEKNPPIFKKKRAPFVYIITGLSRD